LEVAGPQSLLPLMQAFYVDSEEAAYSLIIEAAKILSFSNDLGFWKKSPSKEEVEDYRLPHERDKTERRS
jgi:hypothetical protein